MAVSGLLGWLNIRHLDLRIDVPDEIYSDVETMVTLHVRTLRTIFPSFLIRAHLPGRAVDLPVVENRHTASFPVLLTFHGRGKTVLDQCRLSSVFPVNFFVRFARCRVQDPFVVFPRPVRSGIPSCTGNGSDGEVDTVLRGYDGDVSKIADYTGNEPQKLIHWRLSAKHDQFKVKEMTALAAEPILLDFATVAGTDVEARLSRATYLVNRLVRENRPVGLKLGERIIPPAATRSHRLMLLRELALYDQN